MDQGPKHEDSGYGKNVNVDDESRWGKPMWVDAHIVETDLVICDQSTGKYFHLHGCQAFLWWCLSLGIPPQDSMKELKAKGHFQLDNATLDDLIKNWVNTGLLDSSQSPSPFLENQKLPDIELCTCDSSFTQELHDNVNLILRNGVHDSALLGIPDSRVSKAPLHLQKFADRFQLRFFSEGLLEEALHFQDSCEMAEKTFNVGGIPVHVSVPPSESELPISALGGLHNYLASDEHSQAKIIVFDDSLWQRKTNIMWPWDWHLPLGVIDRSRTSPNRIAVDRHTQTVTSWRSNDRTCVVWMKDFQKYPYWAAATPFRLPISWIADTFGYEFIHAACIEIKGKAVLFVGKSGAGKSTLTMALARLGARVISDDFVLLKNQAVQSVYVRNKLHDWSMNQFPEFSHGVLNPNSPDEKRIIELSSYQRFESEIPIGAVVLPFIGDKTSLTEVQPSQAFLATALPSLAGILGGVELSLARIAKVATEIPVFQFELCEQSLRDPGLLGVLSGLV